MRSVIVNTVDFSGRPFHFIGIGGIGMSALAYILAKRQFLVSGSDVRPSHITDRLKSVGAHIFNQQDAQNLDLFQSLQVHSYAKLPVGAGQSFYLPDSISPEVPSYQNGNGCHQAPALPQVVCSTAINAQNAEYQAALAKGCPIFHRSDILAALIAQYHSIGVAGTHGKTTTSSLIGYMLLQAGLDPTIIVGGEVDAWEGNARLGQGQYLVAEVDESDGSLTKHAPKIGVVTNIELDHPDHYTDLDAVVDIFHTFESQCETLIGCVDCEVVRTRLKPNITYSLKADQPADYQSKNLLAQAQGTQVEVWERGQLLGTMTVGLPGNHNVSNALAAVAVGRLLGLSFDVIAQAIASFMGAKRRFECKGYCNGITFIDDYAHHPSELLATLAAARQKVDHGKYSRVVAIFQPHRYSRTQAFFGEFAQAFRDADLVILTDIYSAGESNPHQLQGDHLAQAVSQHHPRVIYQPSLTDLSQFLPKVLQSGDLALFLGAGNLNQTIPDVMAHCA
ncbi:UDP-N-acetylmuramate--L-alanine ligase [Synechocystis sp. LKSZ1]|uniref:UDP-N-acetylmuramate--L-alanine ligase n=1 Tax=Synechocystis sp. LKSZ1 TaxID=3144951 RepID=UPI00336BB685